MRGRINRIARGEHVKLSLDKRSATFRFLNISIGVGLQINWDMQYYLNTCGNENGD